MKEKIKVSGVYKSFGVKSILAGIDFSVNEGEIFCIIGKSGTGKSVTLKVLAGILEPDSGEIFVDNEDYTGAPKSARAVIEAKYGILFQGAALFDSMDVYDNVAFGLRRKGVDEGEIAALVPELLELVGLRGIEKKSPAELSGGMQKRVGLARSIAMRPEIMLYDEPTTGVDPIIGGAVGRLIIKMRDVYKITSIVVTHDIKLVGAIADRVVMLHEGKIIFDDSPDRLMQSIDPVVFQFVQGKADGPIKIA
ncbi:MAG: ATP-binding cassette domain-containing protein [Leptospirales bacterium]|nr:ATP-binding cassette domain-containing protein [Leptospirales bacterium]